MRRRKYLSGTGLFAATMLGGYVTDSDERPATFVQGGTETGTEPGTGTAAETASRTSRSQTESGPDGEPEVVIGESELVVDEGEFGTDVYVTASLENVGGAPSGAVEVTVDWYDEAGDYLDNGYAYLNSLDSGEVWAARVYFLGTDAERVSDYEVTGEYDTAPPRMNPDGLRLLESDLRIDGDEALVSGRVANERDGAVSYVEANAKIYDDNGVVIGGEWTNVADLPAGEVWAFDVSWWGWERVEEAADHTIWMTDSVF
ncbi:hypothetical protein HUG10_14660 [Halorarum halophilum]|uniref:Uncharacterized protein n=1 Tax=Halorarum halophilum TaxID=2743090 RepID=A0A7D5GD42_9EURY|nr:FxLYD domain-containing protein [Halobaculum halophilum]QLG28706.1 hypothetical protein HUG10_14660 [Halobaculum halophilum]